MGRKLLNLSCSLLMVMTVFFNATTPAFALGSTTKEATIEYAEPPYNAQLDSTAKIFYNALSSLYTEGKMKSGVGSYDLSTSFEQAVLKDYANGDNALAKAFQSARDAFVMDYPEIFYVDFSKVTLRLGMKNGTYVLYLNNGANENYYTSAFTSQTEVETAIAKVNEKKNQMKALITDTIKENPVSVITMIHNQLIETTTYTYPSKEDRNVSNVYGALVEGKANCDGYSRAFKWILDDYDITNVLVAGVGKNALYDENDDVINTMNEYHQWNYVKLDGKWYAVDVTWDDPMDMSKATDNIRTTYLLRGSDMLNENHFPLGSLSDGGQEFQYPKLEKLDYGVLEKDENIDLGDTSTDLKVYISKVEYPGQVDDEGNVSKGTRYIVNYKNMTYEQLAEQGLYVAVRFGLSNTDFAKWESLEAYENNSDMDPKNLFDATVFTKTTLQFCITNIQQPEGEINYGDLDLSQDGNHVVLTKTIDAPYYQNFTPPPFIRTSFPALTETILPEKTHYAVEYYEELEKIDETKDISIKINNSVAHIDGKVENITVKESSYDSIVGEKIKSTTVEFDFTPDSTFQGYANVYRLEIENMQGVKSKKAPNQIPVITTYVPKLPCPMIASAGGPNSAFVMSNPKLVVNDDMSKNMFQDKNGNELTYGNLNIALVATKTTGSDKEDLDNVLGNLMNGSKASSTFELSLGCGSVAAALRPGYQVSVGVPYPEGFHPEDYKDVEFRAYHFKEVNGEWVSEEIICQITPQGLMIIADSFSPFTIVAYDKEDAPASTLSAKTVNVSAETAGGSISTDKGGIGTYAVLENDSRTFSVTPDEGYMIDKIIVNNTEVKVSDSSSYTKTFAYASMQETNDMKVFFVAKKVIEEEKQDKVEAITPVLVPEEVKETQPVYVNRTFEATTSENVNVKATGILLQDASLTLTMDALSAKAIAAFEEYSDEVVVLASGAPVLSIENAFQGEEVIYEIPVETTSTTLTFLTYDPLLNTYVKQDVEVEDGKVSVIVSNFAEFALVEETSAEVNKAYLQNSYDAALLLIETEYTTSTWSTFKVKLEEAKVVLDDAEATQSEVNDARTALVEAQTALVKRANKEMLITLMDTAKAMKESGKYTTTSIEALDKELLVAKAVADDKDATEDEVNTAYKALEVAIEGLQELGDKTALLEIMEQVNAMDVSKYTEASVKALNDAIVEAQKVVDDKDATQIQIDANVKAIQSAIDALVEIPSGETGGNTGGDSGTDTGDTTNMMFWLSLLLGSGCLLGACKIVQIKKKSH